MDAEEAKVLAEVAKAVPVGAWERAISIVESLVSPAIATMSGIGQLIRNTFDRFSELQKLNTAAVIERAQAKIEEAKKPLVFEIDAKVIVPTLEGASLESDPDLQELWANLLAQEFTSGSVHPLFPKILSQLTAADARALVDFAKAFELPYPFDPHFRSDEAEAIEAAARAAISRPDRPLFRNLQFRVLESFGLLEERHPDDPNPSPFPAYVTGLGCAFLAAVKPLNAPKQPEVPAE